MSLIFSAIAPHPPLLIPNIGRDNLKQVKKTCQALENLGNDLYAAKPDSLIIISPHAPLAEDTFLINLAEKYKSSLEAFGDFDTKLEFRSDPELVSNIKMRAQEEDVPLNLINQPDIDHGAIVPLYFLAKSMPKIPVIPISFSLLDLKSHFKFGTALQKEILKSTKRIAVVASGDLSHSLSEDAPAGFAKEGGIFDEKLVELIKQNNITEILNLDPALIEKAAECGLRSFIILLGILNGINYRPEVLSYEGPFGVGYLTVNFVIK
ncbi:MAG: AmmeMemoRadiSam system protein B [Candidatus Kerfeldbacteria bacterium CG_4_10_14_0_8_um_filter_42_10]|uniref:AmmeMemoRadiSam system protein B n=1 Tax=Candidatus Kerfeldbacteria bacterium CG_4_10_14_0_8_um_filter_42_10 TaxID=2014248 RepID=A0A2M7RKA4_9BACT|nr:MAG: AmmeMemoRadiSam system protein B [Candidatus Kerfeldbacteria bacterium CG_4_10_14_0_8_um_filter_42_10]